MLFSSMPTLIFTFCEIFKAICNLEVRNSMKEGSEVSEHIDVLDWNEKYNGAFQVMDAPHNNINRTSSHL